VEVVLSDLELIVRLQGIDLRCAHLRQEIAALPKEIATIERALEAHKKRLEADQALLAANQRERRLLEGEVQSHQQKIAKLRDQMGGAKTNEQYRAFQNEIGFIEQQIKQCEDRALELMLASENLDQNVKAAEAELKRQQAEVERRKAEAKAATEEDRQKLAALLAERQALVKEISAAALGVYERLAKKVPQVVSEATGGRCTECRLEIRPQLFQDLKKGDRIIQCENCRRILYYNPPVAFDESGGGPAGYGGGTRVDMS
jgi:predicted  nucleic acid-binding Zn-ribbon protein